MIPAAALQAARILVDARAAQACIDDLPVQCRPDTADEGYVIQGLACALENGTVAGWKAAWTSRDMQELRGLSEPAYGRIFASCVYRSPAIVAQWKTGPLVAEAEFSFRLGRALPVRKEPYGRDEVIAAVSSLHPAIEVAGSRFCAPRAVSPWHAIADNSSHAFFVEGAAAKDWRSLDLIGQKVTLRADGELLAEGTGAMVLGDPITSLQWVVNKLSSHGIGLEEGQLITTGTCLGAPSIRKGAQLVADFGPVGQVSLKVTA